MSDRSRWTHTMCDPCWAAQRGEATPVRMLAAPPERCCYCGALTISGIFIREDPTTLRCGGWHEAPDDAATG